MLRSLCARLPHFSPRVGSTFLLPCVTPGSWLPPFWRVFRWQFCILPNNEVHFRLSKERKAPTARCPNRLPERIARCDRVWFSLQVPPLFAWSLTAHLADKQRYAVLWSAWSEAVCIQPAKNASEGESTSSAAVMDDVSFLKHLTGMTPVQVCTRRNACRVNAGL